MSPYSQITSLASSIHARPGSYALLIGSGVSRASGIQSGWEIATDLTKRVAILEDGDQSDSVTWYKQSHGADVDYSQLLEMLATSRGDRQALLKNYLSSAGEGKSYQPTEAHVAIAQLVKKNFVRIILTTNFDRLIENALAAEGIRPLVIYDEGSAFSAPPLYHADVVVIKIHGDIESPNLKNTINELANYGPNMAAVLREVFSNFGLLICGWSGQWDTKLGQLLHENPCEHFSSYWTHVGPIENAMMELVSKRKSLAIQIDDAETFFPQLASRISALEGVVLRQPNTREILISEIKTSMVNPERRVILEDLINDVARGVIFRTREIASEFPRHFEVEKYQEIALLLAKETKLLSAALTTLGFYGRGLDHEDLVIRALNLMANAPQERSGIAHFLNLQKLPLVLALYSLGIGCLLRRDLSMLTRCLREIRPTDENGKPRSLLLAANPIAAIESDLITSPKKMKTGSSDFVFENLKAFALQFAIDEATFNETYDNLEYLFSIISMHEFSWAPMGRFTWRHHMREVDPFDGQVSRIRAELIAAGLFDGDDEKLNLAINQVGEFWDRHYRYF